MKRIGVWLPNWIGDACMATPALNALRSAFNHDVEWVGVMRPAVRDLLEGANSFDQIILYEKICTSPDTVSRWGLVSALRRARLDTMLLLPNSWWTALVSRIAGVTRIVGAHRDGRGWLLSDRIPVERDGRRFRAVPAIDYYLHLASWLGCQTHDRRTRLVVTANDTALTESLWEKVGFDPHCPTVVINSGGATSSARLWPRESVSALARQIVDEHDWQIMLHCGPAEREACQDIVTQLAHPRVRSMGEVAHLPIGLSKGVLARSAVTVSTDSGPRHMAMALAPRVVSLFGPTDPSWTRTYNGNEITVEANLPCRACWKKTCPLEHGDCMKMITVAQVYKVVVEAMASYQTKVRHAESNVQAGGATCSPITLDWQCNSLGGTVPFEAGVS